MDHTGGPEHNTQFKKTELKSFLSNLTTYYEMVPVMQLIYFRGTTALVALHTALTQRVSNPQSWARDNTAAPRQRDHVFRTKSFWLLPIGLLHYSCVRCDYSIEKPTPETFVEYFLVPEKLYYVVALSLLQG